jgi:hypothetical protein
MKTYLIYDNCPVGVLDNDSKAGARVLFSRQRCKESINANREFNLVNAQTATISRAKKWSNYYNFPTGLATEINPGEFYIDV